MNRTLTIAIALLALVSLPTGAFLYSPIHLVAATPYIESSLQASWSSASPDTKVEVVVTLDHIPTSDDAEAIANLSTSSAPMTELPMILSVTTFGRLSAIAAYPGVVSLWENRQLEYLGPVTTTTHNFGEVPVQHSWWNDVMKVPQAWSMGYQGQGVTVAVVDSGIDAANPSLGYNFLNGLLRAGPERVIQNVKVEGVCEVILPQPCGPDQIYIENQINTDTTSGHGTAVAGLVAGTGAVGNGIYKGAAPRAKIVGLGAGETLVIFHVVGSYNWILSHRGQYNIKIVNNSYGTAHDDLPYRNPNHPINVATRVAHSRGITSFFSAGNSGPGNPTINPLSEWPWVISVAAGTESRGLAEFSSRGCKTSGPTCDNVSEQQPDVTAPGINVISTKASTGATINALTAPTDVGNIPTELQPYYITFGGTSAASPMAAGVGALVLSARNLTPDSLKATLKSTADPMLGYLSFQTGNGYTNALSAVRSALGKNFTPTTTKVENFGVQRFVYTAFTGGQACLVTTNWISANFPAFKGAQRIIFEANWQRPATPLQWDMIIYAPNDTEMDFVFTFGGETGMQTSIDSPETIAAANNPGFKAGTWDVQVINFCPGDTVTLTVDVVYPRG